MHTGPAAGRAARAAAARAYTVVSDIVFGDGHYHPDSPAGQRLIAHELAHVVQQRGGQARPNVDRSLAVSKPSDAAEREADLAADQVLRQPSAEPAAQLSSYAATLQRQATGGYGYEFQDDPLNAGGFGPEDQTIRVRPGPVRTTLIRPRPAAKPPRLRDKQGYTFKEKTSDNGQPVLHDASNDDPGAWAQAFLTWAGFDWTQDPLGAIGQRKYVLRKVNDKFYDVAQLKDVAVGEALAEGLELDPAVVEAAAAALARPATPTSKKDVSTQLVVSWTFVPKQISTNVKTGATTASKPIQQVQGQFTWKFHKDDDPGFELSAMGQAQLTKDPQTGRIVEQHMIGGQAAAVTNFFTKFVRVQAVAQVLGGATFVGADPIVGAFTCYRNLSAVQPTGQVALGAQSVFTIPGTKEHLQLVLSVQGALTDTAGLVTFDRNTGIGIQLQF